MSHLKGRGGTLRMSRKLLLKSLTRKCFLGVQHKARWKEEVYNYGLRLDGQRAPVFDAAPFPCLLHL